MKEKISKEYVNPAFAHFVHGADYNPEQWKRTKEIWDEDVRLMKEASMNAFTLGVFAWAEIEPEEGKYDFSVFDEIIDKTEKAGGKIILATPSGARPRWMAEKYPEVLRTGPDGRRDHFGGRHNHCFSSPVYREKVKNINTQLAKRYSHRPALIAWHISNEYGGECYCDLCKRAFRDFLKNKFGGDIDKLNHAYWTAFWSHTYSSFDEIEPPSEYTDLSVHGLNLDWRRFVTAQTVSFMKNEIGPLKSENASLPVTTNMMYGFEGLDYYSFRDVIDFASWDCYPEWHSGDQERTASEAAFWHDYYRSLKNKPFFLMESTPSMVNWHPFNKPKKPGLDVLSSLQAVFHGADSVCYFQYRKSRGSSEKLHGAVIGHDGTSDTRVFRSVKKTGDILKKIDEICASAVESQVAIIYYFDNMTALNDAQGYARSPNVKRYKQTCYSYYHLLWKSGINVSVCHPHDNLSRFRLVIAPMLYMTDDETISNLCSYVRGGGHLLSTYFTGTVDENDLCILGKSPAGELSSLFGIFREETDVLYPEETGSVIYDDKEYAVKDFAEIIRTNGAESLASYGSDYYKGMPAFVSNVYGKGKAYYQAFRDGGEFLSDIIPKLLDESGVNRLLPYALGDDMYLPRGVTCHSRTDGVFDYLFIENYENGPADPIILGDGKYDLLEDKNVREISLPSFGFSILRSDRKA